MKPQFGILKKPTNHRFFVFIGLLMVHGNSHASNSWSPEQIVQKGLSSPLWSKWRQARKLTAEGALQQDGWLPPPRIGAYYQHDFRGSAEADGELTILWQQQLDLSGREGQLESAQVDLAHQLTFELQIAQSNLRYSILKNYFHIVYLRAQENIYQAWVTKLDGNYQKLAFRTKSGDSSKLSLRRLGRAKQMAEAKLHQAQAALEASWQHLGVWVDIPKTKPVLPARLAPRNRSLPEKISLPQLRKLKARAEVLKKRASALGLSMLRNWNLGAGYRLTNIDQQIAHGFQAQLSLPLPLWNTDEPRHKQVLGQLALVEAEYLRTNKLLSARLRAQKKRLDAQLRQLKKLPQETEKLAPQTETAYYAGESSLPQLLDAYQSDAEWQLLHLKLSWQARLSALEFDRHLDSTAPQGTQP